MKRFPHQDLFRFSKDVVVALGSSEEMASIVADHIASSHLAGHDSHGVIRLLQYCEHVRDGKIDPSASPKVYRETSTTACVDGNQAWGQVVAKLAVELAVEKAQEHAVAAVTVRNCYHIGRVGAYPLPAARAGFIAEIFCNWHGAARSAPWGGTQPKLATNPLTIAIPTRNDPILVDMTTSVVAEGKVRIAKNAGKKVPEGWIIDKNGRPTTNPEDLYDGGLLRLLGGEQGHKGFGLSVVVDLLGGVLSGAGWGLITERLGNGVFVQVVDPRAFEGAGAFLDRVDQYIKYLKDCALAPGVDEILLPGEPELRVEKRRRKEGVEVASELVDELNKLAQELNVEGLG